MNNRPRTPEFEEYLKNASEHDAVQRRYRACGLIPG